MKEIEPGKGYQEHEIDGNRSEEPRSVRSDREDSTPQKEAYRAFTKDKRARIPSHGTEKVEYRRREYDGDENRGQQQNPRNYQTERRSYNPNFTPDNKPRFERREYDGSKPQYGSRPEYNKPEYNRDSRPEYDRPEYDRGSRPEYDRGSRPEYNRDNRSAYGDRPQYDNNRNDRPRYNDNRGEGRPYGNRPSGNYGGNRYDGQRSNQGNNYGRNYGDSRRNNQDSYNRSDSRPDDFGNRYGDERSSYAGNSDRRNSGGYGKPAYNKPARDNSGRQGYGRQSYDNTGYGNPARNNQYRRPAGDMPDYGNYDYDGPSGGNARPQRGDSRPRPQFRPKQQLKKPRKTFDYPTFPVENQGEPIRLNRYIAMSGICSRREADEFIKKGIVSVNGNVVTELGAKVNEGDEVQFNGNVLVNEKKVYIVMNKPKGFITSVDDPHAEKTVMGLLKNNCRERVYPVGRLDKSSSGVLLITNDGDLAKKLMHPSFKKKKVYQVTLDKALTHADMDSLAKGITLDDGEIHADEINYVGTAKTEIGIEIHSGRNRIVRRMFEHLGYRVTKLDRVYFAGLTKEKLKRGKWRFLTTEEANILRSGMYE